MVTRTLEWGGGQSPSTFDTIHPIGMEFDTYNKLYLFFQLSETAWCLIDFHGNDSQINDVTRGHHLRFSDFVPILIFVLQNDKKTAFHD